MATPKSIFAAKCTAHNRQGQQCQHWAIHGGNVCRWHGGAAPQTAAAAQRRIKELAIPALDVIHERLKDKKRPDLALMAARDVLDRNGLKKSDKVELTGADGEALVPKTIEVVFVRPKE